MTLARMRTADKALAIIKAEAPDTGVTLHYIRQLIKNGKVPAVSVGRKRLVNVDTLMEYIAVGGDREAEELTQSTGKIRKVPV